MALEITRPNIARHSHNGLVAELDRCRGMESMFDRGIGPLLYCSIAKPHVVQCLVARPLGPLYQTQRMQLRTDYITTTSHAAASVGLGPRLGIDVNFEYPRPRALNSALATLCYSQGRSGILSDVDISRFQSLTIMHPGRITSPLSFHVQL